DGGQALGESGLLGELALLTRVAQAASSLDLPGLFRVTLRELDRYLPLYASAVWLLSEESDECRVTSDEPERANKPLSGSSLVTRHSSLSSELVLADASRVGGDDAEDVVGVGPGLRFGGAETPFARCLEYGEADYCDLSLGEGDRGTRLEALVRGAGASSYFAVPLRAGDQCVGVLQSICLRPMGFTSEQIQLLYRVADLLGP